MLNFVRKLWRTQHSYEPLIKVEISRSRLIHNLEEFIRIAPENRVAPVLKSNAYGHGLLEVAGIIDAYRNRGNAARIPFLVVDSYFEARALRLHKVRAPILVIGFTRPDDIVSSRLKDVSFTVTSLDMLHALTRSGSPVSVHLKIDIGMGRQGIRREELDVALDMIKKNSHLKLVGICSHFSDADENDASVTLDQIAIWNSCVQKIKKEISTIKFIHVSNSYGHRFVQEAYANVSRLGIGLYGLVENDMFDPKLDLKPVLSMKSIVTGIKKIRNGETVGYNGTFKADKEMVVATIPVGYYEGVDRKLSNKGTLLVGESRIPCRIVGRVSMNITVIDITEAYGTKIGTEVTVISNQTEDVNSITNMAKVAGTIPYEIVVHAPSSLRRVVVE